MWEDPIGAESYRIREKIAAECNFDLNAGLHAPRVAWWPAYFTKEARRTNA